MKYCIIGAGAFGINFAYNLLNKGHKVELITDKLNSVSSIYARGISLDITPFDWIKNLYIKVNNYNYKWIFIWTILTYANSFYYIDYKKKAIYNSKKIIKSYNLNYDICGKKYFINLPDIFSKMINNMKMNTNFNLKIMSLSDEQISQMSTQYDIIFDCRGSNVKKNFYCENIGGYKFTIQADTTKKCFSLEDGWFLHTDVHKHKNLIVKGGYVFGATYYDQIINNKEEKNKMEKIITNKKFWNKYNCKKILEFRKGTRQYSIDMLPFYTRKNNIISIHGGSAVGAVLAPFVTTCIISEIILNKKISSYDFSEKRVRNHYYQSLKYCLYSIIVIILLKRTYKFGIKRHLGIKL